MACLCNAAGHSDSTTAMSFSISCNSSLSEDLTMDIASKIEHAHHWVIAEPTGMMSEGVCLHCHARKLFRNAPIETNVTTRAEREFAA
jgi:hypothetical protein